MVDLHIYMFTQWFVLLYFLQLDFSEEVKTVRMNVVIFLEYIKYIISRYSLFLYSIAIRSLVINEFSIGVVLLESVLSAQL